MVQSNFQSIIEEQDNKIKSDPFAGSPVQHQCHPSYFNVLKNSNFYTDAVPLEVERYTIFPDSLLNCIMYFDLDSLEIKLLMYIHKKTLGYMSNSNEYTLNQYKNYTFNTIRITYSDFNASKLKSTRSRFYKITMRRLAEELNTNKSTLSRKISKLENLKLIQKYSNRYTGTIIGINYHTINSIFGNSTFGTKEPLKRLIAMDGLGLIKLVGKFFVSKIKTCIENMSKIQPVSQERSLFDLHESERSMLLGAFKGNKYLK
jgi:DNA-binding MarR family transcriptional regulator